MRPQRILTTTSDRDELSSFEWRSVTFARWGFLVAMISFVVAAAAAFFVFQQVREMSAQTNLMGVAARQARSDANENGKAAQKQLSVLQKQLTLQQNAIQLSERPWVGVKEVSLDIQHAVSTDVTVTVVNSGKSPALDAQVAYSIHLVRKGEKPDLSYTEKASEGKGGIPPGVEVFLATKEPIFTQTEVDQMKDGQLELYVYGTVWYRDTFNKKHRTLFCFLEDPKLKGAVPCRFHNEAT